MSNVENEYKWMVRVDCKTFNQASYIEDALNGFCMQETTFPFVCTIIDDASTDGEQDVIRRYLEEHFDLGNKSVVRNEETEDYTLTFARHKTNTNCYFAVLYLKYNHYSIKKTKMPYIAEWQENCKYIALCEGDDYWIVSYKLQKQVDFLEKNKEHVMVYTGFMNVNQAGEKIQRKYHDTLMNKSKSGWIFHDLLWENFIMTLSVCVRRNVIVGSPLYEQAPYDYDYSLFLCSSLQGKMKFIPDIMGAYRKVPTGAVATLGSQLQYMADSVRLYVIKFYFANKNDFPFLMRMKIYWVIDKLILRKSSTNGEDFWKLLRLSPMLVIFLVPVAISKVFEKMLK